MDWLSVLLIAPSLAMDAFAVALGVGSGLVGSSKRPIFRLSFHFGLFQFMMPLTGWLVGDSVQRFLAAYDHWIAFVLLVIVGGRMVRSSFSNEEKRIIVDPTRGVSLVVLSIATSIDALAVGLSLAMLRVDLWVPCVIIGIITAGMTMTGMLLGRRLKQSWGKIAESVGGFVLIAIGLRVVWTHIA
jgi:manganese efflux pump family protein